MTSRRLGQMVLCILYLAVVGAADAQELAKATFAGGCFWCMEPPFDELADVISTTSGDTGGRSANPTYKEVSAGRTDHAEAVEVVYDPGRITFLELLGHRALGFFRQPALHLVVHEDSRTVLAADIAKLRVHRQGIVVAPEDLQQLRIPVVTDIVAATQFWPAEDYHQDYYKKNLIRYKFYRTYCGRDRHCELPSNLAASSRSDRAGRPAASGATLHQLAGGGLPGASPLGRFNRMHDCRATVAGHLDSLGLYRSVKLPAAPMVLHEPGPSA